MLINGIFFEVFYKMLQSMEEKEKVCDCYSPTCVIISSITWDIIFKCVLLS